MTQIKSISALIQQREESADVISDSAVMSGKVVDLTVEEIGLVSGGPEGEVGAGVTPS